MHEDELVGAHYRLETLIAAGATGEVWRAVDDRDDRVVAVKVLNTELSASEEFRARFESEARTLAGLDTPSVATVHHHGSEETAEGLRYFLVMELVDGRSLADVLANGPLPSGEVARIIAGAAEGLQAAHEAGIVHGGIKPADILLTRDGDVKLKDFGAAREVGPGAVGYTAPERFNDSDPTPAADIYALGAVAYECLTGATPFASDDEEAVVHGHLNQPPPALPEDVPETLAEAVYRALRKEPADRWLTVRSFGAACRAVAAKTPAVETTMTMPAVVVDEPVSEVAAEPVVEEPTPEPEAPEDESATARRRRGPILVLAVAVVLIALAAAFVLPRVMGDDANDTAGSEQSPSAEASSSPAISPSEEDSADDDSPGSADDQPGLPGTDTGTPGEESGEAPLVAVPDLVGHQASEAPDLLAAEGFENQSGEAVRSEDFTPACEIWEQAPKAGTRVSAETTIVYRYAPMLLGTCTA